MDGEWRKGLYFEETPSQGESTGPSPSYLSTGVSVLLQGQHFYNQKVDYFNTHLVSDPSASNSQ